MKPSRASWGGTKRPTRPSPRPSAIGDEIEVRYRDRRIRSGGHGFCGISRIQLLNLLQARASELGVAINYEYEVDNLDQFAGCDLILGADGVNSWVRETYRDRFNPTIDYRKTKFVWLGTTHVFDAFTFIFRENEHGWHYLHAYRMGKNQFGDQGATWILECHEDTWRNAGFDRMTEDETVAYYEEMFKEELEGHPMIANRSIWRNFPAVYNENWHFDNVVLIGDACHTAQFLHRLRHQDRHGGRHRAGRRRDRARQGREGRPPGL